MPQERRPRQGSHGYGPYTNGCRCDVCREAARVRRHEQRERYRPALLEARANGTVNIVEGITHGINGWCNFMCRCTICSAAKQVENLRRSRNGVGATRD